MDSLDFFDLTNVPNVNELPKNLEALSDPIPIDGIPIAGRVFYTAYVSKTKTHDNVWYNKCLVFVYRLVKMVSFLWELDGFMTNLKDFQPETGTFKADLCLLPTGVTMTFVEKVLCVML